MSGPFERNGVDIAWCPGCGDFGILKLLAQAMEELGLDKRRVVFASGIGQAAKTPYYLDVHLFDGLHGRALPLATAIKAANPHLVVVAQGGDGDMYGEGGNHFLSAIRRNVDLVHLVHNNMVYGLTKGQASPTSQREFKTKVQTGGVFNEPFNPLSVALSLKAGFVSRVNIGDYDHALSVVKEAFLHKGYALVDIFQPCVTFNKINTYEWFAANTYRLDEMHDPKNLQSALIKSMESGPYPLGIFYKKERETFEQHCFPNQEEEHALYCVDHDPQKINAAFSRLV